MLGAVRLALLFACLSLGFTTPTDAADSDAVNRVVEASLRWLEAHYGRDDTRSIVVDRATMAPAGAEVRGRVTWKTACPLPQHWQFFFDAGGVMDTKRSFVVRKESPRCRPTPLDAAGRRARAACDQVIRERLNADSVKLLTSETTRFGDGGVRLRGTLTSETGDHEWSCTVDGRGRIANTEDDVRVRRR